MRRLVWLLPAFIELVVGCGSIGTGERTIIRHHTSSNLQVRYFPSLTTNEDSLGERVRIYSGHGQPTFTSQYECFRLRRYNNFTSYMANKYGAKKDFKAAKLSILVRDIETTPFHSPELDLEARKAVAGIHANSNLSKEERIERAESLSSAYVDVPKLPYRKALKRYKGDLEVNHYFPRIQIDFSADLLSDSNLDRFSQLAMLILIPESDFNKGVRFINFSPKGADIAEFTRGELTQQSQLTARATAQAAEPSTKIASLSGELSYTATETFVRELKDALEKRTVGIVENGRGFLVQLRAIRQMRIGGTYTFDLMLEIPSLPEITAGLRDYYTAEPVSKVVEPEVILLAVVRHVHDRGTTGWINSVPESENDDVYEQVVVEELQNISVWNFNDIPFGKRRPPLHTFTAKVLTNRKDARFAIFDAKGRMLAHGTGEEAELSIPNDTDHGIEGELRFLSIVNTPAEGTVTNLEAKPSMFMIKAPAGESSTETFVSTYMAP